MNKSYTILVVDDEPNVRAVFRTALETTGYSVDEAADGEEALTRLRVASPDLVLLDLQMPRMDGMEVLQHLRDSGNNVPVVIVTAHGSIPDAVAAMKLGAVDFHSKPLKPEALRKLVAEVILRNAEPELEPEPMRPAAVFAVLPLVLDLTQAKRALNRRQFDEAERLLEEALDQHRDSSEARTLLGVLQESRGQDHAAYQSYKTALKADPHYGPALDNLRCYCDRHGLDFQNKAINPAADA